MSELSIVSGETKPEFQKEETLVTVFKETVKQYPTKTALYFNQQSVTYEQLDQWSTAFAASLQAKGLKQGDQVVIADGSDTSNDAAKRSNRAGAGQMRI